MTDKLVDPDCRGGKHRSCVGGMCECSCHWTERRADTCDNPKTCPVCGAQIDEDLIDVTTVGSPVTYVPGKWSCPNGCGLLGSDEAMFFISQNQPEDE